jgi:hypothetical protein
MAKFAIGSGVRQKSTEGTGKVIGIHPTFPPSDSTTYTVRFNLGSHESRIPEADLEEFDERRTGIDRRLNRDRRHVIVAKDQGQCVLESLSKVLELSVAEVRRMFDEFSKGQQDPSDINHVADVLKESGYVVGEVSKNRAEEKGERRFVALQNNNNGTGHAVVVFEDNRIFDSERRFNENGGSFYAQCMNLGWTVNYILVLRKTVSNDSSV